MKPMSGFDWLVLIALVVLVSVWLVRRIRISLAARCCSDGGGCAGCSGGCGKRPPAPDDAPRRPPETRKRG